jgi:uncharacterized membrane protein YtjA (UPF0391 family)
MLKWAGIFAIIALIAAVLGFTAIFKVAAGIAQFFFILFLIVAIALFAAGYWAYKKVVR